MNTYFSFYTSAIYYDDPDDLQHKYGVQTGPVEKVITELDAVLEDLQHTAETLTIYNSDTKLIEKLNIMVVSDHGHMNFTGSVNVTGVFARYPANVKVTAQQLHVWPKGNAEQVGYFLIFFFSLLTFYLQLVNSLFT